MLDVDEELPPEMDPLMKRLARAALDGELRATLEMQDEYECILDARERALAERDKLIVERENLIAELQSQLRGPR